MEPSGRRGRQRPATTLTTEFIVSRTRKSARSTRAKSASPGSAEPMAKRVKASVHLVSESTGSLALHIASVVLSQFPKLEYDLQEHPFCTTIEQLQKIRQGIELDDAPMVFSALTNPRLKRSLLQWCERRSLGYYDLIGSVVDFVSQHTGQRPVRDATRAHPCDSRYFRRIEAWEFTLQHDDSRRVETIGEADVILLGLSRVGKTPLAAYLGSLGYRVANVSIAPEAPIPPQVKSFREKTIGLTLDPERLAEIRKRRFELNRFKQAIRRHSGGSHSYYSQRSTMNEVLFAEKLFRKLGVRTLDMTDLTVEESAVRILNLMEIDRPY